MMTHDKNKTGKSPIDKCKAQHHGLLKKVRAASAKERTAPDNKSLESLEATTIELEKINQEMRPPSKLRSVTSFILRAFVLPIELAWCLFVDLMTAEYTELPKLIGKHKENWRRVKSAWADQDSDLLDDDSTID